MADNKVHNIYSKEDLEDLEDDLNYGDVLIWKKYNSNEKTFTFKGVTYYKTRKEPEEKRRPGDRIYYTKGFGYYIVKAKGYFK